MSSWRKFGAGATLLASLSFVLFAPNAGALQLETNGTPTQICAAILSEGTSVGVLNDVDFNLISNPLGRFNNPLYVGGEDEYVFGASQPFSGMDCIHAAKLGLRLAADGFPGMTIDYNGSSPTGAPYFVIETENALSPLGLQRLSTRSLLWGIVTGSPAQGAKHMLECYCYGEAD
jgi:hypothetical protein